MHLLILSVFWSENCSRKGKQGRLTADLLAQYMWLGVPIRKQTWKTVSPTAPLFSTFQQWRVNLSG